MRQIPGESDIPMHGWHPYSNIHRERIRAHQKHDPNGGSMERKHWDDPSWLPVLGEEYGEISREYCEFFLGNRTTAEMRGNLIKEVTQLAAMAAAWLSALDEGDY